MSEGVDFSYSRPGGAALVTAGKKFVVRYVGVSDTDGRRLVYSELTDYRAHGLAICLVFESSANRALGGRMAGVADAKIAKSRAASLGFPTDLPIYFAVDFPATPSQYPLIDTYLQGAASVLGSSRIGVYGHNRLMAHCDAINSASWFWQTYAWSSGNIYPGTHLLQYRNGQYINKSVVDLCRSLKPNYGQWGLVVPNTDTGDAMAIYERIDRTGRFTIKAGDSPRGYQLKSDGTGFERVKEWVSADHDSAASYDYRLREVSGNILPASLVHGSSGFFDGLFVSTADVVEVDDPVPVADCTDEVAAATEQYRAEITTLEQNALNAKLTGAQAEWDRQKAGATVRTSVELLPRP